MAWDDSTRADLGHAHSIYACHAGRLRDRYDKMWAATRTAQQPQTIAAGHSPNQTTYQIGCDRVQAAALDLNHGTEKPQES